MKSLLSLWWLKNHYLEGAKGNLALSILSGISSTALACASPFVLEYAQKNIYSENKNQNTEAFLTFSPYIISLILADILDKSCQHFLSKVSNKINENVLKEWIEKVNFMSITEHEQFDMDAINFKNQLGNFEESIFDYLQKFYIQGSIQAIQVISLLALSYFITPSKILPNIYLGYLLLNIGAAFVFRLKYYELLEEKINEQFLTRDRQEDILDHHFLISLYNLQMSEAGNLLEFEKEIFKSKKIIENIGNGYDLFSSLIGRIALLCILSLSANEILDPTKDFDVPDLVTILLFYQLIQGPIEQLINSWKQIYASAPILQKVHQVILTNVTKPVEDEKFNFALDTWKSKQESKPLIEFNNLSFAYPDCSTQVLENVSFKISHNTVNVIVGESKLGKSTISRLILQLYNQYEGEILINNCDIHHIPTYQLRHQIGLIPQHTEFFSSRSLRSNIIISNQEATDAKIIENLNQLELGNLSSRLEHQIPIGNLSGGEQRRVSGLRCAIKENTPLLYIFDEPTTGLDTKTSFQVMEKLREISKKSTVIMITHDLKYAISADQVLFLHKKNEKTIVASGTHQHLSSEESECHTQYRELFNLEDGPVYKSFWSHRP